MSDDVGARPSRPHRGWHERGYLPHFDAGAVVQTVTFRLADSLPREFYEKAAVLCRSPTERSFVLEKGIDRGLGSCVLSEPTHADIVRQALAHFDGERYRLLAWVIMPNHVHVLIEQLFGMPLGGVVHAWKSFTAHAINKARGEKGAVWAPDCFDRFIRNGQHFANVKYYIEQNPVKACLVAKPEDWPYSSATRLR